MVTGSEALIGAEGETVSSQGSEGRVRVKGRNLAGALDASLAAGSRVKVVGRDRLSFASKMFGLPSGCCAHTPVSGIQRIALS
jgi:membrane-bound ClpP family serine protease